MRPTTEDDFVRFRERGDARALGRVYDAVAPELLDAARRLGAATHPAEDLVQGVFLVAMERAAAWDATRPLRPRCGSASLPTPAARAARRIQACT